MNQYDLKRLAEDLLTLEVNTIISDQISAEKMPEKNRVTLYTLASEYSKCLIDKALDYPKQSFNFRGAIIWPYGGMLSYDELRARSSAAAKTLSDFLLNLRQQPTVDETFVNRIRRDIKLFENIESNSSRIVGMFKIKYYDAEKADGNLNPPAPSNQLLEQTAQKSDDGSYYLPHNASNKWNNDVDWNGINTLPDVPLKAYEITRLRKAWDLGTEQIVMQTTLTLDGDVTTRMQKQFADAPNQFVMDMHSTGINTSLNYWGDLMKILGSAFDHLGKFLSGNKGS